MMQLTVEIKKIYKNNPKLFIWRPALFLKKKMFADTWCLLPSTVHIELTNICNFSCIMCANSSMDRKKGFMDFELFKLALYRCEEARVPVIRLITVGEALLHPQFMDMWRMAITRSFKKVEVYTNGSLLSEEMIYEFLKTNKSKLVFSFMGWDRKSYEERYVGGSFDDAFRKLKLISDIVRERNIPNDMFSIYLVFSNEDERGKTKKFLEDTIKLPLSHVYLAPLHYWTAVKKEKETYDDDYDNHIDKKRKPLFCNALNITPGILFDGRVTACGCHAYDDGLLIGDIHKQSILQMRKGSEFQKILGHFKRGDLRGLKCYGCLKYSPTPELSRKFAEWESGLKGVPL